MRRIGGVLFLVLGATVLTACGGEYEPIADVATTTTEIAPTTSTTLAPTTTVAPTTVFVRPTTTAAVARPATTVATTTPVARVAPTTAPRSAAGGCHPSYSGACLPIRSDVNCGDIGAKNFTVVGPDVYRLDADNDDIACES